MAGISTRGCGKMTCAAEYVACRLRAGLGMGAGWGARWEMGGRGQGDDVNSVGLCSSMGRAGGTLEVLGSWVGAGCCISTVDITVIHVVAT